MWVRRLDVVRVSNGVMSVSGSGTTTCPGSQLEQLRGHELDRAVHALAHLASTRERTT